MLNAERHAPANPYDSRATMSKHLECTQTRHLQGVTNLGTFPQMIRGLVILLAFQSLGELVAKGLSLPIPGPVVGLVFLLVFVLVRKRIDPDLATVSSAFSQHLGLLFVPAAVGVVIFIPQLAQHALAIGTALLVSVGLAIGVTAAVLHWAERRSDD